VNVFEAIRHGAERHPTREALVSASAPARRVSYGELVSRADAIAARLRGAGVARGDRVGLLAAQGPGFVEAALGILGCGACLVPIPDDHAPSALEALAARARLHFLVSEREGLEPRRRPAPEPVDGEGDERFRALDPAYLRFTSGTTARRKGVILGHASIQARLDAANAGLGVGGDERVLWLLPMAHHFVVSILLYLREGATVLLPESSLARGVLELAGRERATFLYASPYHLKLLAKDASALRLDGLRLAISTAEGLRAEVAQRFRERFGLAPVQALGIIEVGLPVLNLASAERKPEALGRPLPAYDVWLRGEDGKPVTARGPEYTGELCIRGPGLLDAYLDPWTPAAAVLEPDGFRTGDEAWRDADGDLFLAGRRANRINMAGMKFFCEEVEAVLDAHPAVRESRVFAREHPHLGEIPVAEIALADPAHEPARAELVAFCRERLAGYKIPREFRVVEEISRTATGKVARAEPP
jgi:long-chain acyl-CoA synthetase